jgi:hypothetical protein
MNLKLDIHGIPIMFLYYQYHSTIMLRSLTLTSIILLIGVISLSSTVNGAQTVTTVVGPNVDISAFTDKKSYVVGEEVIVKGNVNPVVNNTSLRMDIYDPEGKVLESNLPLYIFDDGSFSSYKSVPFGLGVNQIYSSIPSLAAEKYKTGTYTIEISYYGESVDIPLVVKLTR